MIHIAFLAGMVSFTGCGLNTVTVLRRDDSLTVPVPIGNPPDSGDKIEEIWISCAAPPSFTFHSTNSIVGPASIGIGESWTSVGEFSLSSGAPLGCQAIGYAISSTDAGIVPDYNEDPPWMVKVLVVPEQSSLTQRLTTFLRRFFCSLSKASVGADWKWSVPVPAPRPQEEVKPKPKPLIPDNPQSRDAGLPRGDFGFYLGAALADVDDNARARGLKAEQGTNVSVKPDEWRDFTIEGDKEIGAITMFLMDGSASQISIVFKTESLRSRFKDVLRRLQKRLGKEAGIDDRAFESPIYLADGKTPSGSIVSFR